uniref:Uncharacterized protein n=1 Tax=Micrurus lemniscatus lemniscatus TaxID=129467 RepID=A0A2D4HNW1_MICLE
MDEGVLLTRVWTTQEALVALGSKGDAFLNGLNIPPSLPHRVSSDSIWRKEIPTESGSKLLRNTTKDRSLLFSVQFCSNWQPLLYPHSFEAIFLVRFLFQLGFHEKLRVADTAIHKQLREDSMDHIENEKPQLPFIGDSVDVGRSGMYGSTNV